MNVHSLSPDHEVLLTKAHFALHERRIHTSGPPAHGDGL